MDHEDCYMYKFVMFAIVGGCICLVGLVCNVISIYAFRSGVVKTPTSYQLIWLAVVDSIYLVTWLVYKALYHAMWYFYENSMYSVDNDHPYWRVIRHVIIVYIRPVFFTAHTCSIWLTVFIAVYRYLAVVKPFTNRYSHIERHGKKYVVLVITMGVFYNIIRFCEFYLRPIKRCDGLVQFVYSRTNFYESHRDSYYLVYITILYSLFIVGLPVIIIIILTARILVAMKKRQNKKKNMQTTASSQGNISIILITIIFIVIICQTPYLVAQILNRAYQNNPCDNKRMFYWTTYVLSALNSAANPFIYFVANKQFRSSLATHCHCTRNNATETIEMESCRTAPSSWSAQYW